MKIEILRFMPPSLFGATKVTGQRNIGQSGVSLEDTAVKNIMNVGEGLISPPAKRDIKTIQDLYETIPYSW